MPSPTRDRPDQPDRPDPLGRRVVVRHRLPPGSQPPLTDVVGMLVGSDDATLTVDGRQGRVTVARADVVVLKEVPPAPVRRGRPHAAIGELDLERLMADGWRAVEEEWEGDWLLRASGGFTTRGNSVLPLGDPGLTIEAAVERAEGWYAERDLPTRVHLVLGADGEPADERLGSLLVERGYRLTQPTMVMTAAVADIGHLHDAAAPVTVEPTLTPRWLGAYARQRAVVPGVTEQVLTGSAEQQFLSTAGPEGQVTSVARLTLHPGWLGLSAVWVDPDVRGQGLGRTLVHAAGMVARRRGLASCYLQVEADHDPAIALYESEGFRRHHAYGYLLR